MDRKTKELGGLHTNEKVWRDRYIWLKDQGYQLRSRFSPDWVPSWRGTCKLYVDFEEGLSLRYEQIIDAIHISTGSRVILKSVSKKWEPFEEEITCHFSTEPLSEDPRNHCVPLLDVLNNNNNINNNNPLVGKEDDDDDDDDIRILVLPFLRPFDSPNFDTFGEALECIRQLFEGLHFMHKNHTAHRYALMYIVRLADLRRHSTDLNSNNFMMQSDTMFPEGYHLNKRFQKPDLSGPTTFYTRTERPSKYYLIDFGHARQYDSSNISPLEPIMIGGDKSVPEFQNTVEPPNPFPTDVYYAGNLVREEFLDGDPISRDIRGYRGFEFLRPLINEMVQNDPTKRPKTDEVVQRFEDIVSDLET